MKTPPRLALVAAFALAVGWAPAAQLTRPAPTRIEIAPDIYLFRTAPYGAVGLDGNSVVIVSNDGVLVFDTNGTPSAASAVLGEIRKLTKQPVRFVVNSHWHWDHWYGTEVYKKAFPDVQIIAHEKTRQMMMAPALEFNRPVLEQQLPAYLKSLEQRVAAGKSASAPPANLPQLEQALAEARFFLDQKNSVTHTFPDRTFTDRLTLSLGGREIQILHHDRAVTPGDAFLYLPAERVLVTGDLLVNPIAFALSCYPTGWLRTLERLDMLETAVIVPGHGDPLRDKSLLRATMAVFRELLRQGKEARARGLDPDQAREAIMPGLADLMAKITGNDPALNDAFKIQLVDWYLHRVFDELNGPLSDAIAPIPVK